MGRIQEIQFELIENVKFNSCDGKKIVSDLRKHPELWRAALMWSDLDDILPITGIPYDEWIADTLFILPETGQEEFLYYMACSWDADTVDWIGGRDACDLLGEWSKEMAGNMKTLLRVWWD